MGEMAEISPAEVKRNNYNKFVRKARLVSIVLENLTFKNSPSMHSAPKSEVKRTVSPKTIDSFYSNEKGVCAAKVQWSVHVKQNRKIIASCRAEYVIIYEGVSGFNKDIADLFVDNVASVSSYAYFRGLFAHLDWAAEGRSPPLPVFRSNPKV